MMEEKAPTSDLQRAGDPYDMEAHMQPYVVPFTVSRKPVFGGDEFKHVDIPKDAEGFVKTFECTDAVGIREFFDKYGLVAVRDVLTPEECAVTESDVWRFLQENYNADIRPDKPHTWTNGWPTFAHLGILGNLRFWTAQAFRNRQNPKIHAVFSAILGTPEMMMSVERVSVMRPTTGLKWEGKEELVDMPKWGTMKDWVHIDLNPYTKHSSTYAFTSDPFLGPQVVWPPEEVPYNETRTQEFGNAFDVHKLQGVLAVVDCSEKEGGFHAVPGFHHHITKWAQDNKEHCLKASQLDSSTVQLPDDDPIRKSVQTMPIRKGTLLIWSSYLPHGTFPNKSNKPRIIQYIKAAPIDDKAMRHFRLNASELPKDFEPTELGLQLLGLQPWRRDDQVWHKQRWMEEHPSAQSKKRRAKADAEHERRRGGRCRIM